MLEPHAFDAVRRIVSHKNCPDGIASAMILKDVLTPSAEVVLVQYGTSEHEELLCTEGMVFCDMSPPPARVHEFVAAGAIVLDHHKSAKQVVAAFGERGIFADEHADPGVSGAVLAFDHVWQPRQRYSRFRKSALEIRKFAQLAGVRDTWQTSDPRWREACAQAHALLFWGKGERLLADDRFPWLSPDEMDAGRQLYAEQLAQADAIARTGLLVLGRYAFFNDTTGSLVSDVAEAVRRYPMSERRITADGIRDCMVTTLAMHADVLVAYRVDALDRPGRTELRYVYSLRSLRPDVDVSLLAKRIHGGGHTKAAGGYLLAESSAGSPPWLAPAPWTAFVDAVDMDAKR
jgi:hypothetical protein